jgi:hypothetical protein
MGATSKHVGDASAYVGVGAVDRFGACRARARRNRRTTLPQVVLGDIGLACMQASPDRAHGARVQVVVGLEENRRKN